MNEQLPAAAVTPIGTYNPSLHEARVLLGMGTAARSVAHIVVQILASSVQVVPLEA